MADTIFTGSKVAAFKGIEFHKYLMGLSDSRPYRRAEHPFPKRDGARQERMGRAAFTTTWRLAYIGKTAIDDLKKLAASLDDDPTGSLVHPIWGQMQAFCDGMDPAVWDPSSGVDTIEFTLVFHEDQLDAKTATSNSTQGPAAKSQQAQASAADYTVAAAALAGAVPVGALGPVTSAGAVAAAAATSYALAAASSALNVTPDNSLEGQLAQLVAGVASTEAALEVAITATLAAIPAGAPAPGRASIGYPVIAAGELMYAAALALQEAVIADRPARIQYTVGGTISLVALCAQLYGGQDALARYDEIMALNRIPNPAALAAGTLLTLTTPTVVQP